MCSFCNTFIYIKTELYVYKERPLSHLGVLVLLKIALAEEMAYLRKERQKVVVSHNISLDLFKTN